MSAKAKEKTITAAQIKVVEGCFTRMEKLCAGVIADPKKSLPDFQAQDMKLTIFAHGAKGTNLTADELFKLAKGHFMERLGNLQEKLYPLASNARLNSALDSMEKEIAKALEKSAEDLEVVTKKAAQAAGASYGMSPETLRRYAEGKGKGKLPHEFKDVGAAHEEAKKKKEAKDEGNVP